MVRPVKLGVRDEIENALAYFNYTFIAAVPALVTQVEDAIADITAKPAPQLPALVSVGSWVGGDRDGNPFVTAEMLEQALRRHGEVAFDHYLEEVHALGAEPATSSALLTRCTPERWPWPMNRRIAHLTGKTNPIGAHSLEPHARSSSTAEALGLRPSHRSAVGRLAAIQQRRGAWRPPSTSSMRPFAPGATRDPRRGKAAVASQVRHGIRLPSGTHRPSPEFRTCMTRCWTSLLREAGVVAHYRELGEMERQKILLAELANPRPLRSTFAKYSELATSELAIFEAAAAAHQRFGEACIRQYIISKTDSVSRTCWRSRSC